MHIGPLSKHSVYFPIDDFISALQSSNDTQAQCIAACTMEKERFVSE